LWQLVELGLSIVVGVLPWLAYIALHGRSALQQQTVFDSRQTALGKAVGRVLPAVFVGSEERAGAIWTLRSPGDAWLSALGVAICLGALLTALYAWRRRAPLLGACGISVLLWPPILTLGHVPLATDTFRYAVIVVPPILLIAAYWASKVRLLPVVAIAAMVSSTWLIGANTSGFAADARCDPSLTGVSNYLAAQHLTAVWAAYWLSGPLDICSNQRITASPVAPPRDRVARDRVVAEPRSVYVVFPDAPLDHEIAAWTRAHRVGAERRMAAGLAVWVFDRRVDPGTMGLDSAF
jgi:hypothetical protein